MEKKGKIKKLDKTQIYFILKGIFVGLLTGIVVSLFRLSIEKLSDLVRSESGTADLLNWPSYLLHPCSIFRGLSGQK